MSLKGKSKHNVLKSIDEIADTLAPMREQSDGIGNSRAVATQSVFKEARALLKEQREKGMDERFSKLVLEKLYETLEGLIPIAEHQYRKYPGDRFAAMSFSTYVKQMQEIMKDIRSIQNFEEQAERITRNNTQIMHRVLQNFADEIYKMKKAVHENIDIKTAETIDKVMMRSIESYSLYLNESLKAMNQKVEEQLVRDA